VSVTLADVVVAQPFATAALLACVGSWRAGVWINATSASLLFVVSGLLPWHTQSALPAHLALLTGFVAMTTSWFGWRDIRAALVARQMDRRRTRHHHVAFQALLGAILLAVLSDSPAVTWFGTAIAVAAAAALTGATRTMEAQRAAGRLLLLCGIGLMLALFGTLLLYLAAASDAVPLRWSVARLHATAPNLAGLCLVLGYCGIAGLVPLHSWLPDAAGEGTTPGAIMIGALLVNVPLFVILHLRSAMAEGLDAPVALLMVLGLATLLLASFCLSAQPDMRRSIAVAATAQIGIIVFAFGLGGPAATLAGLLVMTMLTLARAATLQCPESAPTRAAAWTRTASVGVLAGLPILALFLIAGATAHRAPWLLLPLGAGALLTAGSSIGGFSTLVDARERRSAADLLELAPVWLQLAVVAVLAVAMPGVVADWFRAVAELG
jgi:hydrogenase-4 component F